MIKIYQRDKKEYIEYEEENSQMTNFFYEKAVGRVLLKVATRKSVSKLYGCYIKSRFSRHKIKKFIGKYNINLSEFKESEYKNFNDFFIRERKVVPVEKAEEVFVSVADAKLSAFNITEDLNLKIKNSNYLIEELIKNKELAKKYRNGLCLVFRLSVDDYHRYCYVDDGRQEENKTIKGVLHTVRPIAHKRYKVFSENNREWTVLHTENFGDIVQIEVGAIMIGKINNHKQNNNFLRGEEKGYFSYGGSTIVLLVENDKVLLDEDILKNSEKDIETKVKIGERIGIRKY